MYYGDHNACRADHEYGLCVRRQAVFERTGSIKCLIWANFNLVKDLVLDSQGKISRKILGECTVFSFVCFLAKRMQRVLSTCYPELYLLKKTTELGGPDMVFRVLSTAPNVNTEPQSVPAEVFSDITFSENHTSRMVANIIRYIVEITISPSFLPSHVRRLTQSSSPTYFQTHYIRRPLNSTHSSTQSAYSPRNPSHDTALASPPLCPL